MPSRICTNYWDFEQTRHELSRFSLRLSLKAGRPVDKKLLRDYIEFADGVRMTTAGVRVGRTMDKAQYAATRVSSLAKMLPGATTSSEQMTALLCGLLEAAGLTPEQRLELLGGAFVAEAVRPHWNGETFAERAHDALRAEDCELADAVEALAQVLLGRAQTRDDARDALAELDRLFSAPASPEAKHPAQPGLFEA